MTNENLTQNTTARTTTRDAQLKLATKLKRLKTAADVLKALEKAGQPDEVLASLASADQLTLEAGAALLQVLADRAHYLPAETVIAWLEQLPAAGDKELFLGTLPDLAWPVRNIVRSSYKTAPEVWNAALPRLAGCKRDAVLLAQGGASAGTLVPAVDRARMLEALLSYAFSGLCVDPSGIAEALGVTGSDWGSRALPLLLAHPDADAWGFLDAVALAEFSVVEAMVLAARPCQWFTETRTLNLLRRRKDDAATIVGLANQLRADARTDDTHELDKLLEALGGLALERAHAAGAEAPHGTEELLNGSHFESEWRNQHIVAYASTFSPARLEKLLQQKLGDFTSSLPSLTEHQRAGHGFAGMLRVAQNDALTRQWVEGVCEAVTNQSAIQSRAGLALGDAGPYAIPFILEALAARPQYAGRDRAVHLALRAAVLVIAGELARSSAPIPEALDKLLCGDEIARSHQETLAQSERLAPVLQHLPAERGASVIRSWLALESEYVHKQLVKAVPEHLRALVVQESPPERITRLARETGLPCNQRLYALLPVPWNANHDDNDIAAIAGNIHWANAIPKGLAKQRIPQCDGKPMQHVITFDLEAMPELRERFDALASSVRAVALFVSAKRNNDAGEPYNKDMEYVMLSNEEACAGFSGKDGRAFTVTALDVPEAMFGADHTLGDLRRAVYALPGHALGAPSLIQAVDSDALNGSSKDFIMQLGQQLVDMNLGDEGRLYLYRTTSFWQSH